MVRLRRRHGPETAADAPRVPAGLEWFWEKYHDATAQIVEFCSACRVELGDREIADVGCGEGSMALALGYAFATKRSTPPRGDPTIAFAQFRARR